MKAAELLRLYEAGRRDFRGQNLRGQDFRGENLSGVDFREADIRSTNFTNANLRGTNFANANAGLQQRYMVVLLVGSFLLSGVSGPFSNYADSFFALKFEASYTQNQVIGWGSLSFLFLFQVVLIRKGFGTVAAAVAGVGVFLDIFLSLALAITGVVPSLAPSAEAESLNGFESSSSYFFAEALAFVILTALILVIAVAVALAVAGVFAGALVFARALALALAGGGILSGVLALTVTLVSAYIAWRLPKGDEREEWIRPIVVRLAAIGGTSFQSADLTDANFTQAQLKSTDLSWAMLTRTNWYQATKLDWTMVTGTILSNSDIRELVVTHRGQGKSYSRLNPSAS
ncbi:MAG: pentapeptide repeat-containing protein [Cyanobacteria bacterium P01_F01_bin.150]